MRVVNSTGNDTVLSAVLLHQLDVNSHIAIGFILTLTSCIGLIVDVIIINVFVRTRKLRSPTNWLIFSLVISDFVMSSIGIPMVAISSFYYRWTFGEIGCNYYAFLMCFMGYLSIFLLTVISVSRYIITVKSHLRHLLTYKSIATLVSGCTVCSLIWSVMPLLGWSSYSLEAANTSCSVSWDKKDLNHASFSLSIMIFNCFLPFTIILYCYTEIFRKMKSDSINRKRRVTSCFGRTSEMENKITKTIVLMIAAFIISWFPYVFVCLWTIFGDVWKLPAPVAIIPTILAKVSVIWNPLIYIARNGQFRTAIAYHLSCGVTRTFYDRATNTVNEDISVARDRGMNVIAPREIEQYNNFQENTSELTSMSQHGEDSTNTSRDDREHMNILEDIRESMC